MFNIDPGRVSAVHSFEIRKRPFKAFRRQRLLHLFCLPSPSVCRHNAFSIPIQVIAYYIAEHIVMIQAAELMIYCFHVATVFNVKLVPGRGSNPHNASRVPGGSGISSRIPTRPAHVHKCASGAHISRSDHLPSCRCRIFYGYPW